MQSFFERLSSNYVDIVSTFAIPMIIGIFALAFPLLFQTASRIDDKYNSTLLIKVFRKDCICRWFITSLLSAIICCVLWVLQLPRLIDCGKIVNIFVDNSALILLIFSTIFLVITTILSMRLMYIYYMPEKLLQRMIKQYHKANSVQKELYFYAISKILFYSIKKEDEQLARELQSFFYKEAFSYRKNKKNEEVVYPNYFYEVLFDANECLCQRERRSISLYNNSFYHFFIDEDYFISKSQHAIISDDTYKFLWRCLIQSVLHKKEDFVFSYWRKAHQYMDFSLNIIEPEYDNNGNVLNQYYVNIRQKERKKFIKFHDAFRGWLMLKGEYMLVNKLNRLSFQYTQMPERYNIVPFTKLEAIKRFLKIEHEYPFYYVRKYNIPDFYSLSETNDAIQRGIKRYIAVHYLCRYYADTSSIAPLDISKSLCEISSCKEKLENLKIILLEMMDDKKCLKSFDIKNIVENNRKGPVELIDRLINELEQSYSKIIEEQSIDTEKNNQLKESTKLVLCKQFDFYNKVFNNTNSADKSYISMPLLRGEPYRYGIVEKMVFATEQDIGFINYDRIFADSIVNEFRNNLPKVFRLLYEVNCFVLSENDLFNAIDKLHIKGHSYTIISVGVNLRYYAFKFGNLENYEDIWKYKGIPIVELERTQVDTVNKSLFIMRNEDLPCIVHNDLSEDIKNEYALTLVDDKYHIYANVIDLYRSLEMKNKIMRNGSIKDLDKYVLVCVGVNTEVRCNKNAKCIQLRVFSQFDNIGNPNKVEDVKNIWSE